MAALFPRLGVPDCRTTIENMDPMELSRLKMMTEILARFKIDKTNISSKEDLVGSLVCSMCKKNPNPEPPLTRLASCCAGHFCCNTCAIVQKRLGCTRLTSSNATCRQKIVFVEISLLANVLKYPKNFFATATASEDVGNNFINLVTLEHASTSTPSEPPDAQLEIIQPQPDVNLGFSNGNCDPLIATGSVPEEYQPKPRRPRLAVALIPSLQRQTDKPLTASSELAGAKKEINELSCVKKNEGKENEKVEKGVVESFQEILDYACCEHDHCQDETFDPAGLWNHMMTSHFSNYSDGANHTLYLRFSYDDCSHQYPDKSVLLVAEAFGEKFILFQEERRRSFILYGYVLNDLQTAQKFKFTVDVGHDNDDTESQTSYTWGTFPFGTNLSKEDYMNLVLVKKVAIRIHKKSLRDAIPKSDVTAKRPFECCQIKLSILKAF